MNRTTRATLALAALGLTLSGCVGGTDDESESGAAAEATASQASADTKGSDSAPDQGEGKGSGKKEATPQDAWAKELCEGLAPTAKAIDPPSTTGGDVAESKKQVLTFLQTLHDRLEEQNQVLKDAGAPPKIDGATYKQARTSLKSGTATLDRVIKRFEKANPKDASQMQDSLVAVGEALSSSASYPGPLAELSASEPKLKQAFANNEQCVAIMS